MSLLPPSSLDSIVSIEIREDNGSYRPVATGFLAGFNRGGIFLVTNRHVFRNKKMVWLRFNKGKTSERYPLVLINQKGEELWSSHPNPKADVALIPINAEKLQAENVRFSIIPESVMAFRETRESLGITTPGDEIFVLGFPMGISGVVQQHAIIRGGVIARLDDDIIQTEHSFLIDCSIFPGNSGGPVIIKPTFASASGTPLNQSYLIGVVKGYLPYSETAYSLQGGSPQPRVEFMENSGLALVVPLDYVRDIVNALVPPEKGDESPKLPAKNH